MTIKNNIVSPASGEDNALQGFTAQYLVAAELIIQALQNNDFEAVILKDPEAGKIDDVQIITTNRVDAYQIKWHNHPSSLKQTDLIKQTDLKSQNGRYEDGFIRHLADGWKALCNKYLDKEVYVHLYTNNYPNTNSDITNKSFPSPRHLAEYINTFWQSANISQDINDKWLSFTKLLENASGLTPEEFERFRLHCNFDLQRRLPDEREEFNIMSRYYKDIVHLKEKLLSISGIQRGIISLTKESILDLAEWNNRFQYKSRHEFPTPKHYSPISETVENLKKSLHNYNQGYIALIGSPGSGKSTLLTKTLRYRKGIRLIHYYCFIPNDSALHRGEAYNFLHDLVLSLKNQGIGYSVGDTIEALRNNFESQLQEIANQWKERQVRTVILIDGLDHIKRESNPKHSLLHELPLPEVVPEGCLFILGSQYLEQIDLNPRTLDHLQKCNNARTIQMGSLPRRAIRHITTKNLSIPVISEEYLERIETLSGGHPLALNYILNRLNKVNIEEFSNTLKQLPQYGDNIESEYQIYWRQLERDVELKNLLAILSRMRGMLDLHLMSQLASEETLEKLEYTARHYFVEVSKEKRKFFHNSFRQFILDKTGRNPFGIEDKNKHQSYHAQLAQLATQKNGSEVFQWELIYHLFHSGDYDEVLKIATQDYFRGQFFALCPLDLVMEDTVLLMRAAKERKNKVAIIRVLLIQSELSQREYILERVDIFNLLFLSGKRQEAIKHVLHEGSLLIDPERALKFACDLMDDGYIEEAKEIFTIAEPLDKFSGTKALRDMWHETSILEAWVRAAVKFRTIEEIIEAIRQVEVPSYFNESSDSTTKNLRIRLFRVLIDEIIGLEKEIEIEIEQLPNLLADYIDEKTLFQRVHLNVLRSNAKLDKKENALNYLLTLNSEKQLPESILLTIVGFLFQEKRDFDNARDIFNSIKIPLRVIDEKPINHDFSPYLHRFRYYRLKAALGNFIDPTQAVPNTENDYDRGNVLIERMVVRMAHLMGKAWKGELLSPSSVMNELMPVLFLSENRQDHSLNMAFTGKIKPYLEMIIYTASSHGKASLLELSKYFEQKWQNDVTSKCWSDGMRRYISLTLFKAGTSKTEFISRLKTTEPVLNSRDNVHEFLDNCNEQAEAWLHINEIEKAQTYIPLIIESSFGIYNDKDLQIYYWVQWFNKALEQNVDIKKSDFHIIVQGIATSASYNRGGKLTTSAIVSFLSNIAQYNSKLSNNLKELFWDEGAIDFYKSMEAFVIAGFRDDNVAVEIPLSILCRLYLPYVRCFDDDVIEAFVKKLLKIDNKKHAEAILQRLISAIELEISPSLQGNWWNEIDKNLQIYPDLIQFLGHITERLAQQKPTSRHTKGSVTLLDGSIIEEDDLIEQAKSYERLVFILENLKENHFIQWRKLVNHLCSELTEAQTKNLFEVLKKIEKSSHDGMGLIKKLYALGNIECSEEYALHSLGQSVSNGWSRSFDGGSRVEPYKILVKINPKYHDEAFQQFTDDYPQGYPLHNFASTLEDLIEVFWEEPPLAELWYEIFTHFSKLHEFEKSDVLIPDACKLLEPDNTTLTETLLYQIFETFKRPQPELREDAYKVLLELYDMLPETRSYIQSMITDYLKKSGEYPLLGMALIKGIALSDKGILHIFTTQLTKYLTHDDMAVRMAACDIFSLQGKKPSIQQVKALLPCYTIILPAFPTMEHNLASIVGAGTIFPETNDTLQLVGVTQEALEIIHHKTKIPFRNLVERTASLMKAVLPEKEWNSYAEQDLMNQCKTLNIESSYRRPRALAGSIALGHVVAELYDANQLIDNDLLLLYPSLSICDSVLSKQEPIARNLSPAPLTLSYDLIGNNSEWMTQEPNFLPRPPITDNNEIILGFITKTHVPTWDMRFEYITGTIAHPYLTEEHIPDPESIITDYTMSIWWKASQYPNLPYLKSALNKSFLIYGSSQRTEIGRKSWLALNPIVAKNLGWSLSDKGLFQWVSNEGEVMVESQWWRSGRMGRYAYAEGMRSEGWLVKASDKGYKALSNLILPPTWAYGVKKGTNKENKERDSKWTKVYQI